FFFQAEDGIRDWSVTGVQTCALPIYGWAMEGSEMQHDGRFWRKVLSLHPGRYTYRFVVDGQWLPDPLGTSAEPCPGGSNSVLVRSEERRVGKECRCRW